MSARTKTQGQDPQSPGCERPAERPEVATDRRSDPRHSCDIPLVIEVGGEPQAGRIRNYSRAGILVVTSVPLDQGMFYDFLFIPPGARAVARIGGQVRWALNAGNATDGPHCAGVQLVVQLDVGGISRS